MMKSLHFNDIYEDSIYKKPQVQFYNNIAWIYLKRTVALKFNALATNIWTIVFRVFFYILWFHNSICFLADVFSYEALDDHFSQNFVHIRRIWMALLLYVSCNVLWVHLILRTSIHILATGMCRASHQYESSDVL